MLQRSGQAYDGYRDVGVRLSEPLLPSLARPSAGQLPVVTDSLRAFDRAHLVMLIEEGLVDREAGVIMLRALVSADSSDGTAAGGKHAGERYLIRNFGQRVGGQLHLGRSSGDLGAVARRLTVRTLALSLMDALIEVRDAALRKGSEHLATVMPGATHMQHAQPTTFGHWAAMWDRVFARDFQRVTQLVDRVNHSPAGAGVLSGSDFPLNRARTARLLGFDEVLPNTLDAVQSPDDLYEAASVTVLVAADLERLAADLQLFFSTEFGYMDVPDRFCGTSSIMPQKRNPAWMGLARAVRGEALAALVAALTMADGPTGAAIGGRNIAERQVFGAMADLSARLAEGSVLLAAVEPDRTRLAGLTGRHWAAATDLAAALVRNAGLDWRSAHQVVGVLVRMCNERSITPDRVRPALLDEAAVLYLGRPVHLTQQRIDDALDPRRCVERRTGVGGPAPATHRDQVKRHRGELRRDRRRLGALRARLRAAEVEIQDATAAILGTS
jgi:argininosuccinate lyase